MRVSLKCFNTLVVSFIKYLIYTSFQLFMVDRTIQWLIWFGLFCLFPLFLCGQNPDAWSIASIKTLRTYVEGNELAYPVIELNSDQQIRIEFDVFSTQYWDIEYQVIHCNNENEPSNVMTDEFMQGFETNRVSDYSSSVNTTFDYVNYRLLLPNDDVKITSSGKYKVRFFTAEQPDSTIAYTCFWIYESVISIDASIVRPTDASVFNNSQELRLKLNYNQLAVNDVYSELKVELVQNGCPWRKLSDLKPVFIRDNELVYGFSGEHILPGGNEFRMIDIRSLKYKASSTNQSEFKDGHFVITPRQEESRSFKRYFTEQDLNGQYMVYADHSYDYYKAADYAYVNCELSLAEPILDGSVYIIGAFNYWAPSTDFKLNYIFTNNSYQGTFLLKQGIYDYMFVCKNSFTGEVDLQRFEGSHDETENNYQVFVYYKGVTDNLQRLVGYRVVNSKFQ